MKRIIILGCGIMQMPAYKIAKREGWYSIGVDGNDQAPAKDDCDEFWHIDLKDRIGLAEAAQAYSAEKEIHGVFTAGTDFSATVAWIAEKMNLPGIPYQTALNASDKFRMRQCLQEAGLMVPAFMEMGPEDGPEKLREAPSFPLVVKPVDNMGARGVRRVDAMGQLQEAVDFARSMSRSGRAIIEEYLPGPEFSLDALVYKDRIQLCGIADREIVFPPYFVERGHHFPSRFPSEKQEKIREVFYQGIKALGIHTGAAKGDLKLTPKGPVIGEIAARLSGGFMSGWTFPYASGQEPVGEAMKIALGIEPELWHEQELQGCAERAIISIPGCISRVEGLEEAYDRQGVKDIFLMKDEGDRVSFPTNNVEKVGNVIASAPALEDAIGRADKAAGEIIIRLEKNDPETAEFLSDISTWPGAAYNPVPHDIMDYQPEFNLRLNKLTYNKQIHLPEALLDESLDPQQRKLSEQMILLKQEYGLSFIPGQLETWDKDFWFAFYRGGIQGARWLLDSVLLDEISS